MGEILKMGEQLAFIEQSLETVSAQEAWYPLAVGALSTIRNQWTDNTREAYRYGLRSWHDWAREFREPCSMPPRPEAVVAWLHWQATVKRYARSTILLHLAGLTWADQWSRREPGKQHHSLQHHPLVRAWKRGHARESTARVHDPIPPTLDELRLLISACHSARPGRKGPPRTPCLAARDRAFLLLSYFGAMRKREIHALRAGDVRRVARGIEITFRCSKTDQTSEGEMRAIYAQDEVMMCPVDAWDRWIEIYRPAPNDPAFCALSKNGVGPGGRALGYHTIDALIANRCRDAGIRRLHPHQLRAAFATHALESNDEGEVVYHGRWKSRSTMVICT